VCGLQCVTKMPGLVLDRVAIDIKWDKRPDDRLSTQANLIGSGWAELGVFRAG
jgi:hypothetical protein